MRRFRQPETGYFLGIWLFFMVVGRSRLFRDPGTFWHTVAGRRMLSTGHFIRADPFSFTFAGKHWIPYEWLGECVMGILDRLGGLDMLLLMTATLLSGLYAWVAHRLRRSGLHWLPAVLVVMLTIAASANHLHVRPHLSTIVFVGLTFGWLCDFEAGRTITRRLFWLIPIFWIWSNMHGGAMAGLAMMVVTLAGWCAFRFFGLESPVANFRQVSVLLVLIVACGVTFVVNPYGLGLPRVWLQIMKSPVVARLIEEHAPLDMRDPVGWIVMIFVLAYAGTLASVRPWRPRATWLIPILWFFQAVMRVRHSPLFGITAVLAMAEMLPHTRLASFLARPGRDLFRFRPDAVAGCPSPVDSCKTPVASSWLRLDWRLIVLPASVILLAAVLQSAGVQAPVVGRGWVKLDREHWPVELLPELRQVEREHPEGSRIFNEYLYGGFLIYYTPGLKVFIDDRCELYGDDWLLQFYEAMRSSPNLVDHWQEKYRFTSALVMTGSPFDRYLARSRWWRVLKRTNKATLYGFIVPSQSPEARRETGSARGAA